MWKSVIFGEKPPDFLKFLVCPHGQGGSGGQFLAILCGRLLWTAPK